MKRIEGGRLERKMQHFNKYIIYYINVIRACAFARVVFKVEDRTTIVWFLK